MLNGVINIYKEKGFTSHDVVAKLRGILKQKKIGHTGTLDPDATGVLPVCLGKGTKLCDMLLDKDKTYKATLLFGSFTDTEDISGTIVKSMDIEEIRNKISDEDIEKMILSFQGEYDQIPPMYSALKVNGKKMYELAREGIVIERKARRVDIKNICIDSMDFPRVSFTVTCSKGTYIRSLCRDICEKLNVAGCMEILERVKVSRFSIKDSLTLNEVAQIVAEGNIENYILPVDEALDKYKKVMANNKLDKLLHNGNGFNTNMLSKDICINNGEEIRMYDSCGEFIGIYKIDGNLCKLVKMFYEKSNI